MARIDLNNIIKTDKTRNTVHDKVLTKYTAFELEGKRYVQFDTYGRIEREMPEKISQSLQFDEETARYFIKLLSDEFDL